MPRVKFNPTGTHIQHGFLKVRVDIYPSPSDKTYPIHYVDKPIIPPEGYQGEVDAEGRPIDQEDYNSWIASLPTYKELNPCLCHFIKIDPETILGELMAEIRGSIAPATFRQIDDILSDEDRLEKEIKVAPDPNNLIAELNSRREELVRLMKPKAGKGRIIPYATDTKKLKEAVDKRFAGLEVEV